MNIDERIEALAVNIESLHSNIHDLYEVTERNSMAIKQNTIAIARNSEHINALARLAEIHERRLSHLEGASDDAQQQ